MEDRASLLVSALLGSRVLSVSLRSLSQFPPSQSLSVSLGLPRRKTKRKKKRIKKENGKKRKEEKREKKEACEFPEKRGLIYRQVEIFCSKITLAG